MQPVFKRFLDFIAALLLFVLLSPILFCISVLVYVTIGRPILFRQVRPGMDGKLFTIFKFRTMLDSHGSSGDPFSDDLRLTRFSRLLRSASMDELPELINVLKGEMSFVGPRPLLAEYLPRYTPEQARRHEVRPGITGWAQVNGRNGLTWEEKFECDVWYIDNWSLWLDLRILCRTFPAVTRREGISQQGRATVDYFTGSHTDSSGNERMK